MTVVVRFRGLPVKLLIWIGMAAGIKETRTCQFSPAIRASSRSSVFSRILALFFFLKKELNSATRSFHKRTNEGRTVPSHSYISRFPLVFLEVKVQDSYSPFEFPEAFLLVVVGQADLEELEWRVVASDKMIA